MELSLRIVPCQICIGHISASFPLLSACRLVEFDSSVCSMVICMCLCSFLLLEFVFEGETMKFTVNMLLTCILYFWDLSVLNKIT